MTRYDIVHIIHIKLIGKVVIIKKHLQGLSGRDDEDMSFKFDDPKIKEYMMKGHFGLEKESLRVTPEGYLAHTRHPFMDNPNMERDFCENQTELITGVADSVEEVWQQLAGLQKKAVKTLLKLKSGKEFLWPFYGSDTNAGTENILYEKTVCGTD